MVGQNQCPTVTNWLTQNSAPDGSSTPTTAGGVIRQSRSAISLLTKPFERTSKASNSQGLRASNSSGCVACSRKWRTTLRAISELIGAPPDWTSRVFVTIHSLDNDRVSIRQQFAFGGKAKVAETHLLPLDFHSLTRSIATYSQQRIQTAGFRRSTAGVLDVSLDDHGSLASRRSPLLAFQKKLNTSAVPPY